MICKRVALMMALMLTLAACGPKDGGGAAPADGGSGAADEAKGGDAGDSGAVGAGDAVSSTAPIGMISSGTVERPTEQPSPEPRVMQSDSKRVDRAELLKTAPFPLFELARESDDDQFSYFWVTARNGDSDPTLPMARLLGTLNFANAFVLTEWAAKDGAVAAEEGEATDVMVGDVPGKLWTIGEKTVITWDRGETRLRIQSTTFDKDALLEVAAKLVPMQ